MTSVISLMKHVGLPVLNFMRFNLDLNQPIGNH